MKVVCISAHPDDLEISAGGTLMSMCQQGHTIISVLTVKPSAEINPNRDKDIVQKELRSSYDISGFELRVLDTPLHDNGRPNLSCTNNNMSELSKLIDICDLAIIPNPQDSHQDHKITYELAWPIVQKKAREVWLMESWPYCYHYKQNSASIYKKISWESKEPLLECYSSYLTLDHIEKINNLNMVWGDKSGNNFAEAFTLVFKYD